MAITARNLSELEETAEQTRRHGVRVIVCPADFSVAHQVDSAISRAIGEFGRIDILETLRC